MLNVLLKLVSVLFLALLIAYFSSPIASNAIYYSPSNTKYAIIDPSSSSGNIAPVENTSLDVDVLVNPNFPNFVSLPPIGDTISKRPGFAFVGSHPSFEAKLNNKKNNITVKSVDIIDSQNKTFFEVSFSVLPVPNTEDRIILTLNIPNTISPGLAKYTLNTNNGAALSGELEIVDFFNITTKGSSKVFGEPTISRTSIKKFNDSFFLTIEGKNYAPKTLIYTSKNSPNEKIESASRSNTSVIILPSTLEPEIEESNVLKGNETIKVKFKLSDSLKDDTDAVVVICTPRGIISKTITLKSGFFGF